jgi:hypothetical protein
MLYADDIDVKLTGTDAAHGFSVFDNASTPLNLFRVRSDGKIGIGTATPNFKLDVRGNVGISASGYLNFGTTEGSGGYGFRDNSGVMEYKNTSGTWTAIPVMPTVPTTPYQFSTYSFGQIAYNHGNYGTTQPSVNIGSSAAYATMFPVVLGGGGGTPWEIIESGDVSIAYLDSKPAYLKIAATGTYRISASVAIQGTSNSTIEVEVFRQNSTGIPAVGSWITLTHDLEALSTTINVTNNLYEAGSITGFYQLNSNDYIALCARVLSGSANTQKVICVNLNVERIK